MAFVRGPGIWSSKQVKLKCGRANKWRTTTTCRFIMYMKKSLPSDCLREKCSFKLLLVFEKFTNAYLCQIALEIMWLPIMLWFTQETLQKDDSAISPLNNWVSIWCGLLHTYNSFSLSIVRTLSNSWSFVNNSSATLVEFARWNI